MAEEVHLLYPEGEWALNRLKKDPAHLFFKRFGDAVPKRDWNHPGTKQGVYMIGPNAEYLDGGGRISGSATAVKKRLRRALERWKELRREKRYANAPVPLAAEVAPPGVTDKPLVFRVHLRDLPRGKDDDSGRRVTDRDKRDGLWIRFVEWAWNENWIGFDDPRVFVPRGKGVREVELAVVMRLCREVLVDNVRGQARRWKREHVKHAELRMRRIAVADGRWTIEYRGRAEMDAPGKRFAPRLYGRAVWNTRRKRFESFDLLAIGERKGAGTFNQRRRDPGPAPMGVALGLFARPR